MKLGIMQPYFFPYLGYYDLINRTDRWVVFDVVKYAPRSWTNRNRILHPTKGWQYISVPVERQTSGRLIKDTVTLDAPAAGRRILGQIDHYRQRRAPFFQAVSGLVEDCFGGLESDRLRDLNVRSLSRVCTYLDIPLDLLILSEIGLDLPEIDHPGGWAVEISAALGATDYVNLPNGRGLFDPAEFAARGVSLRFTHLIDFKYSCRPYAFVDHLSIVDVLMWNSPEVVKAFLDARKSALAP